MEFNAPKNFKDGKYILGKYRLKDFVLLVLTFIITFIAILVVISSVENFSMFTLLIILLPLFIVGILTTPVPTYVSIKEWITLKIDELFMKKKYHSFGIYEVDKTERKNK